jgi:hypothetical protein
MEAIQGRGQGWMMLMKIMKCQPWNRKRILTQLLCHYRLIQTLKKLTFFVANEKIENLPIRFFYMKTNLLENTY